MPSWSEGYVSDITYTSHIYREQMPSWIGFATLLMGYGAPDIAQPFRVAELGCGYGMSLAVAAACSPQAEFWGFDFNPAHIEAARELATEAGLTNLRYEERAFADLLSLDLPDFDFVLMHGVWSWVGANARRAAVDFIKAKLRPGGLVYNSYNVMTGWSAMLPVRALMRLAAQGNRSEQAFPIARTLIEQLRQNGAGYFIINERALEPRLKMLEMFDARYLAHEFLNEAWEPMMFADVAAEMAEAKCAFVASAMLSDNMNNASVPGNMAQVLQNVQDVTMRETLRDLGNAQVLRRDIYRRGAVPLLGAELLARAEAVVLEPAAPRPEGEATFPGTLGPIKGKPEIYDPVFERLAQGAVSVGELRHLPAFAGRPASEALQSAALLTAAYYAYPRVPDSLLAAAKEPARRLNRAFARRNELGANIPHLVAPALATAVPADMIDTIAVDRLLDGADANESTLTDYVMDVLHRTGRTISRDGKPIEEPDAMRAAAAEKIRGMLQRRPLLVRLGIL